MMSPDEFDGLKQDIRANGLRTPVLLYENKVLDGRNRYAACREIGVKPHTIECVAALPNYKQAVVIERIAVAQDSDDEFPSLQKLLSGQGDNDRVHAICCN